MRALVLLTLLSFSLPAMAQTSRCDELSGEQARLAADLLGRIHPYDCCDDTIKACLDAGTECSLVARLANDVCRQVAAGMEASEIERAMSRRAQSMMPSLRPATIDVDEATRAGDASAPVTLVMYACVTCPFCYAIASDLHQLVTEGELKGKVKLYYRSYPLRDHENSVEGGLALVAAARLGEFWPFAKLLYSRIDDFSTEKAVEWAGSVEMNREEFEKLMTSPEARQALAASRREGMANRVSATPTFFINGRRYTYETSLEVLKDVLQEEHARVTSESTEAGG